MPRVYKWTAMPKSDFKKIEQLYWNHTSAWVFCKFTGIFSEHLLIRNNSRVLFLEYKTIKQVLFSFDKT